MSELKKYEVEVNFTTSGTVIVTAETEEQAKEIVDENIWVIVGNIGVNDDTNIVDWDIDLHTDKEVMSAYEMEE